MDRIIQSLAAPCQLRTLDLIFFSLMCCGQKTGVYFFCDYFFVDCYPADIPSEGKELL